MTFGDSFEEMVCFLRVINADTCRVFWPDIHPFDIGRTVYYQVKWLPEHFSAA